MQTQTRPAWTPAGLSAATATMAFWGVGIILFKVTTSPVLVVAFWRHAWSIPILGVAWLALGRQRLPWAAAGVGGALFAAHQVVHIGSLRYSTAAVATILFSLQPIVVGIAGRRVTGERASRPFYIWALGSVAGCGVLVGTSGSIEGSTPLGTAMAVANLFVFSAYYLATKRSRERTSTAAYLLVTMLVSGSFITILGLVSGQPLGSAPPRQMALFLAIAVVATTGHLLITWAHPRIHAAASSAVNLGVPVVGSVGAWIFVGEPLGAAQIAGGIFALGSAAMAVRHLPPTTVAEAAERYGELAT